MQLIKNKKPTNVQILILLMTGVKPRSSGIESDRSTNWATTTSILLLFSGSIANFLVTATLEA